MTADEVAPRPPELAHQPALDGLRAVAVLLVLLFHGGVPWAGGGYLGVEIFFVLSGFLITSLLLVQVEADGRVDFAGFWRRRARRLLPALFVLVVVCALYERVAGPARAVPDFRADGLATLFYVANWHQIWTGAGYFAETALVSPLQHTWSLAIEEQFYLCWPLLLTGLVALGRRRAAGFRPLLVACGAGALASAAEMAWLYHGGSGLNRVYFGTDTRASGLLVGAGLAVALRMASARGGPAEVHAASANGLARLARPALGLAGAGGVAAAVATTGGEPAWLFEGGFLAFDLAVAAVIWAAVAPAGDRSPLRAVLSLAPLRQIGLVSYGLYLWHFPLFLWLTEQSTGVGGGALLALRLAATAAVSVLSYLLVEQPVRLRRLPQLAVRIAAPASALVAVVAVLVSSAPAASGASGPTTTVAAPTSVPSRHPPTCLVRTPPKWHKEIFHTCPPIRAMVVGDSIGLTLGIEITLGEQRYGVTVENTTLLGCSFAVRGESDAAGAGYGRPASACVGSFPRWRTLARRHRPAVAVVEMGYWDEMDWQWDGRPESLGSPAFDAYERERIALLATDLLAGARQVLFLSVPLVDPQPWPNGEEPPQASPARNRQINALLASESHRLGPRVHFLDLAPWVTPTGTYEAVVDGAQCRMSDGIHFYLGSVPGTFLQTPCGARLQQVVLDEVRRLAGAPSAAVGGAS